MSRNLHAPSSARQRNLDKDSDLEFLQKRARLWLESLLNERFPKGVDLSELLADGEILSRVAKLVIAVRNANFHEDGSSSALDDLSGSSVPQHVLTRAQESVSGEKKQGGRKKGHWVAITNVDAFLKVCRESGLTDVNLFSPSDIVDKKDSRRVCLCLRALALKLKAQSKAYEHMAPFEEPAQASGPSRAPVQGSKVQTAKRNLGIAEPVRAERGATVTEGSQNGAATAETQHADAATDQKQQQQQQHQRPQQEQELIARRKRELASAVADAAAGGGARKEEEKEVLEVSRAEPARNGATAVEEVEAAVVAIDPMPVAHSRREASRKGRRSSKGRKPPPKKSSNGPLIVLCTAAAAMVSLGALLFFQKKRAKAYQIKKGDTLTHISSTVGSRNWKEIAKLNPGIKNPDVIYPNEVLRVG